MGERRQRFKHLREFRELLNKRAESFTLGDGPSAITSGVHRLNATLITGLDSHGETHIQTPTYPMHRFIQTGLDMVQYK